MTERTNEELFEIEANKKRVLALGFEYGGDSVPGNLENNERVVKVNLPQWEPGENWSTRNGEGVWAYLTSDEAADNYSKDTGTYEAVLLSSSFYYMGLLNWGTVIQVDGNSSDRPVLDKAWMNAQMARLDAAGEEN